MIRLIGDRVTTVVLHWGKGTLVDLNYLISASAHGRTRPCAARARPLLTRMRAVGEQAIQDLAAGDSSPATANEQPATPIVAGARGYPRAIR